MNSPFTFKKIDSQELLEAVFRLRYQVYCKEHDFISELDCPEGQEADEFDEHSVHFGAFDIQDQLVGAVRLILPSCSSFPVEETTQDLPFGVLLPERQECAEISRLTISKHFLQSSGERPSQFLCRINPIVVGLCNMMYQECTVLGINHCFALMEKPLWLLLKLHGLVFWAIGPEVDYYGTVTPYVIDVLEHGRKGILQIPHRPALS